MYGIYHSNAALHSLPGAAPAAFQLRGRPLNKNEITHLKDNGDT